MTLTVPSTFAAEFQSLDPEALQSTCAQIRDLYSAGKSPLEIAEGLYRAGRSRPFAEWLAPRVATSSGEIEFVLPTGPVAVQEVEAIPETRSDRAVNRYREGYRRARWTRQVGDTVQVAAIRLAALCAIGSTLIILNQPILEVGPKLIAIVLNLVAIAVAGLLLFAIGTLVKSQGEQHETSLDLALFACPDLEEKDRHRAMEP